MRIPHHLASLSLVLSLGAQTPGSQDLLQNLGRFQDF